MPAHTPGPIEEWSCYRCDMTTEGICPTHRLAVAAPALLEALERVSSCIVPHKTEPNIVWIDTESLSTLTPRIRAAIAQAKGETV